jgi:hypothetical protein
MIRNSLRKKKRNVLFSREQKHIWKNKCVIVKHNLKKDLEELLLQEEKKHVLRLFFVFHFVYYYTSFLILMTFRLFLDNVN